MKKKYLDLFGKVFMTNIPYEAIDEWERNIEGKMKDEESQKLHNKFSDQEKELISFLVPIIGDTTLNQLLWTIEQEDLIEITVKDDEQRVVNINEISDGLAGEMYTKDGWISRFSNKSK